MKSSRAAKKNGRRGGFAISTVCFLVIFLFVAIAGWYDINSIAPDKRLEELEPLIVAAADKHGIPPSLGMAIIWKESRFRVSRVGKAGEIGLMQIMPGAVDEWLSGTGQKQRPSRKELFQPEVNLEIGMWYLGWCGRHWANYASAEILQIAEYNAGYSRVFQWKPKNPQDALPLEQITISSTRDYVRQVLEKRKHYDLRNAEDGLN